MKHPFVHFGLLIVLLSCGQPAVCARSWETVRIAVDCGRDAGALEHFWGMTGFDYVQLGFAPHDAGWIQGSDQRQQLIYASSVPHGGITHMRIHNLLYMVSVDRWSTSSPRYDWSGLDQLLDFLVGRGFKPFFEMMGVPRGVVASGRDDPSALRPEDWRRLAGDLARHLIGRYGRDEVRGWHFEVWNEPDNWGLDVLCRYYDACSAGLKDADPLLKWGGPGTWTTLSPLFRGLLAHCDSGTNSTTGESGTRMIRTYEVLYADSPDSPARRVNKSDLLCTAFLHVRKEPAAQGTYRVWAVDYWGRSGEESEAITD